MLLKQLEYFHAVIETGSFYEAAERCHVSQSAISQQIKKLEEELNVQLLLRHNRTFSLTPAGEHFYKKSVIIRSDLEQLIRQTRRIEKGDSAILRLGVYKGYHGTEFSEAIAEFSEKYPAVQISVMSGSHDDLYYAMEDDTIDLALNDQRRAFSDAYHNLVLSTSTTYIEISSRNPLCRLSEIDVKDLKNTPCILVINAQGQEEERKYYDEYVGLHGDFLFSDSLQDARIRIITNQGYMPIDEIGDSDYSDTIVTRIPLVRNGQPITKAYCAFWRKENSGYYIEEFADILKKCFPPVS
jgi:DNA-binding transcriptional LysR family regulator